MVKRCLRNTNGCRFVVTRTDDEKQDFDVARTMKHHRDTVYHIATVHGTDEPPLQRLSRKLRNTILIERDQDATIGKGIMVELCMRRHGAILNTHQLQHVFAHLMTRGWGDTARSFRKMKCVYEISCTRSWVGLATHYFSMPV